MFDSFFPSYFEWWHIPFIFLASLIGESFGALVGGGGLITLPVMLFMGVPVQSAVAIAILLVLAHTYFVKNKPNLAHISKTRYAILAVFLFLIGLYANLISVGEGTFSKAALMSILGFSFIQSQGLKSTATMPARIYSLVMTAFAGLIIWPYLLTKWCSNFLAGKYATKFVKKIPDHYMKNILTVLSIIFAVYLLTSA